MPEIPGSFMPEGDTRSVAEVAYLEHGTLHAGGRTGLRRDELERFAAKLRATDHVVLEATGNAAAIVNVLRAHVAYVATANPLQVRLIAEARVKTDKIDDAVLAQLYAGGFLPKSGCLTSIRLRCVGGSRATRDSFGSVLVLLCQ